ncbi:cytochrome P450 [Mycena belliarum]|uniref:Cytochrome P450 n=1 Tax=Mycena belliarum TaxID=1033014 RepID=A0AAD6U2G3_9AGAR|nr:cytochrome P450 [Mycena belliae]
MIYQVLLPIGVTLLSYVVFYVLQYAYREYTSPLRHVVGPKNPSFVLGNFRQMAVSAAQSNDAHLTEKWRQEFGPTFQFKGLFSVSELHTSDIKALNHIVTNSNVYQRPPVTLEDARQLLGRGLLTVSQDEHKRQRRIMNPAFGIAQIRLVTEVFIEKSVQLRDIWAAQTAQGHGTARVEVMSWLRKMTLDVIGQAGFDYQFNALDPSARPNELNQAFTDLFHSPQAGRHAMLRLAQAMIPILKLRQPMPGSKLVLNARTKMTEIGTNIVLESKASIKASGTTKELGSRRDLLSVLLKANMSTDIPESQRMTDAEVIAQIPAFFIAGHETTSSSTTWALHALSMNPGVQKKLREELQTMSTDNPTMDELNSLPYLELVLRETMRIHAPVVYLSRMAMQDDVLPLAKPYIDQNGQAHESLPIPKGLMMHIPILALNTDKEIWGPDANEFRPERWEKIPDAAGDIPGVWANLFTFFAGPHNCIGFRFSLVEMKALLFTLVRAFEFEPAVPKGGIGPSPSLLQRPIVLAEPEKTFQLPLILKSVNAEAF